MNDCGQSFINIENLRNGSTLEDLNYSSFRLIFHLVWKDILLVTSLHIPNSLGNILERHMDILKPLLYISKPSFRKASTSHTPKSGTED